MKEQDIRYLAEHLMLTGVGSLNRRDRQTLERLLVRLGDRRRDRPDETLVPTLGERLADRVAEFGGSWTFIVLFMAVLVGWALLNTDVLGASAFDPYPYVFLNLLLSMLAAIQAPIIMMSQNRQAARDRIAAARDYETNLRAERKIDELIELLRAKAGP
ncbi:DUF1003 domain-containing protein [Piscinibacter sp. XHJ-5]|uniref:DUF1003 domain-containing protein n=1 Tax=Piscinibacter sp. XHJ-5 TaxID=3037797 RepID=UPI00245297B8|nr:DUF1003 domain-containing protein [Piscinibacter sp. XHJ-5]